MRHTQADPDPHLEKVKHFHDLDASQYQRLRYRSDSCEGLAYVTRKALVLSSLNLVSGRVLDIGCGPGIFTKDLLERNLRVYSADLSMEMIKQAKAQATSSAQASNAFFVSSNVSEICFSNRKIDIVLCIGVVSYVKDYMPLLSEINRVLRLGGMAIIQIDNIRWPIIYRKFVPFYRFVKSKITKKRYNALDFKFNFFSSRDFLRDLEAKDFKIIDLLYYDFRIPFIDILLPKLSVKLGSIMFQSRFRRFLRHIAHGILIKCTTIDGDHST
jgi:ubiquinone/menaquinone biosynthesis C-methylase UbiE